MVSQSIGDRLSTLLDKKKADTLTATENFEIEAIAELDEIFSYLPQLSLGYCHKIFIKLTVNVVSIFTHSCLDVDRFCVKLLRLCKKATLNTKNLKFYGKKESSKLDIG